MDRLVNEPFERILVRGEDAYPLPLPAPEPDRDDELLEDPDADGEDDRDRYESGGAE